jgi:hypothetical protein
MKPGTLIPYLATALVLAALVGGFFLVRQLTAMTEITAGLADNFCPLLLSSDALARNVSGDQGDLLYDSLSILARRKDPVAVDRALPLLKSDDDYAWLNAALYLGACNRKEAVPYLIKALRHTAWRSKPEEIAYLHNLTGQDFGDDFPKWKAWWEQTHPEFPMDWRSHLGPLSHPNP